MREIKFRANRFGVMATVIEINFIEPQKEYDWLLEDKDGNQIREWGKNLDLMQYTGLKDKNGKEIYEGDIVKFVNLTALLDSPYPFEVEWDQQGYWNIAGYDFELEVLGNIYENPELLK